MANPVGQALQSVPPKQRGIIYILITIATIVAVWIIVKEVRAYIRRNQDRKDPAVTVKDSEQEYKDQTAQGQTKSFPDSDYSAAANTIEQLLDGCETYQSEIQAIQAVIAVVKKPVDWSYLKTKFGVRELDNCGPWTGSTQYDLPTLLKDQLDTSVVFGGSAYFESIEILRKYFKGIGISI